MNYILEKIYDVEILDKILEETAEIRDKSDQYFLQALRLILVNDCKFRTHLKQGDYELLLSRFINTETGDYIVWLPPISMYDIDVEHRNLIYYKGRGYIHVCLGGDQYEGIVRLYKELPPEEDQEMLLEMLRTMYRTIGFNGESWNDKKWWTQFTPTRIKLLEKWIGARNV